MSCDHEYIHDPKPKGALLEYHPYDAKGKYLHINTCVKCGEYCSHPACISAREEFEDLKDLIRKGNSDKFGIEGYKQLWPEDAASQGY